MGSGFLALVLNHLIEKYTIFWPGSTGYYITILDEKSVKRYVNGLAVEPNSNLTRVAITNDCEANCALILSAKRGI